MIKVLPEHIYNLIAAGEVIQRPASVVKELMENSADAGASSIMLLLNDYGKTLIQVIDDGAGMDRSEAELCFLSHATSKIESAEDLERLSTFGFRGEALASIAACADVTLKTRKRGEEIGTEVHIAGSKVESVEEAACPQGCNIAVRNLFYNIPARRKFLKSDASEYRQIIAEFTRVALTRLNIEFKLINGSKEIMHLSAGKNLKQRIAEIVGLGMLKDLIGIEVDTSVVKISGYIGSPQSAKKTQQNTFLFANGRFFRSPMMHRAVIKGYSNLIPDGCVPGYFIFLDVAPDQLDVNISPSKTEVKFENEQVIFTILESAVKEAIGKNAFAPMIEFDTEGVPPEIASSDAFNLSKAEKERFHREGFRPPRINYDPLFNPFDTERNMGKGTGMGGNISGEGGAGHTAYRSFESALNNSGSNAGQDAPFLQEGSNAAFMQIDNNHIVVPAAMLHGITGKAERQYAQEAPDGEAGTQAGIAIIDIPRTRAKLHYEKYLRSLLGTRPLIQEELFPKTVSLSHVSFKVLTDNIEQVRGLGFEIREFGKDCIVVDGTPADFDGEKFSIEECMQQIADELEQNIAAKDKEGIERSQAEKEFKKKIALQVVRYAGFTKNTRQITQAEANALVAQLNETNGDLTSPLGGYCCIIIPVEEIKKRML